jgi:hypothetical protein
MAGKIMLVGLGGLGKTILTTLAMNVDLDEIIVGSRSAAQGSAFCNLIRLGAAAAGRYPHIEFVSMDLNQQADVARLVERRSPDLILSTATMMPWWLPDRLPAEQAGLFQRAGFGVWLPIHLNLTVKLMQALRTAAFSGPILTAPFPDVVNPVLAALDLAPTCGVGNLAEIVPKVRLLAAGRLGVAASKVHVTMIAHHALEAYVFRAHADPTLPPPRPPYHLEITYEGRQIGDLVEADQLLFSAYALPAGQETHTLTAAAALTTIQALLTPHGARIHVPGPLGLPGGYPVVASASGLSLALPAGLTPERAVSINSASHRFDGIDRILPDGIVEFVPDSAAIMRDTLGYDCERLVPDEIEARAGELIKRFSEYAVSFGLKV